VSKVSINAAAAVVQKLACLLPLTKATAAEDCVNLHKYIDMTTRREARAREPSERATLLADGKVSALAWASMSRAAKVLGATRFEQRDEMHPLLLGRIADWRASSQALAAVRNINQANVALGS
jgi:hypothetical protein